MYDVRVEKTPQAFPVTVDVLVIGGGAAGLTAAIAARQGGAEVMLLERDAHPAGSTAMSQGNVCAAGSAAQRDAGVEDSADRFYDDLMIKTRGTADPVMARLVAEASGPTMDWLVEDLGIPYALERGWGGFFGHSVDRMHALPSKTGREMSDRLQAAAARAGVDVVCGAHVRLLHADADGAVLGVTVARPDGREERIGCGALVVATCGFGANREMVSKWIPEFGNSERYRYFGHEGNDGAGIRWGMALGAAVGGMNAFQGLGSLAEPQSTLLNYNVVMEGGVQVNGRGERFSDELEDISGQALKVLAQPGGVAWSVWDEARHATAADLPEYRELSALGGIRKADTVEALAAIIGADAEALRATLETAADAATGRAPCPFGRDFGGAAPLAPPYRTARVTGALFHTQGGLQLDAQARVVRADGTALPNFFAAGGTARGISGDGPSGYIPAAGLCTAVTLGRLAGARAAGVALHADDLATRAEG